MNTKTSKVFTLRLDLQVFSAAAEEAKKNKRSIGKEIEYVLEKHYKKEAENE